MKRLLVYLFGVVVPVALVGAEQSGERLVFNAHLPRQGGVLEEDRDFFPDDYLDALSCQGMTGVCIPVPLRLVAATSLTPRTADGGRRIVRLRRAAQKCARHGIRLWIYGNEPARFMPGDPLLKAHPELGGAFFPTHGSTMWCPCQPAVLAYMEEAMRDLFTEVPELGGFLNIAYGEGLTTCLDALECCPIEKYWARPCARCAQRPVWQGYREMSEAIVRGIRSSGSKARYLSWFYQPMATPERAAFVADCAAHAPEGTTFLFNFESGAVLEQLGKSRCCADYSLAIPGPGKPFADVAAVARRAGVRLGAKIQTANSHELATIPDLPVPGLLYRKYAALASCGVTDVLQGWSMGGEPGLMLRAATKLSGWDFARDEDAFLRAFAADEWDAASAETVVGVWKRFSDAFALYPVDHVVQYLGPFHAGIVWNLFAFPEAGDILPAWKGFAEENGDRIGECLGAFTLAEAETISGRMADLARLDGSPDGDSLARLEQAAGENPERRRQVAMMRAFRLQLEAAQAVFGFYRRRSEAMVASRERGDAKTAIQLLDEMKAIVNAQSRRVRELLPLAQRCERLGYHADARKHVYSPESLRRQQVRLGRTAADLEAVGKELSAGRPWPSSARERSAASVRIGEERRTGGVTWRMDVEKGDLVVSGSCPAACEGLAFVFSDGAGAGFPVVCHIASSAKGGGTFEPRPTEGTCHATVEASAAGGWRFAVRYPQKAWQARGIGRPEWMTLVEDTYPGKRGSVSPLWPENLPPLTRRGDLPWVNGAAFGRIVWPANTPPASEGASSLADVLSEKILPADGQYSTWDAVYREVDEKDAEADAHWRALDGRAAYDAHRKDLHAKMLEAIGPFPERTPLNAKVLGTVRKDGYRIEKVLFESMPGLFVTANLFLPDGASAPVPAVVMSCGHATVPGKDSDTYLRACVHVVRRGMAAFMFDPYEQGERRQYSGSPRTGGCCDQHNLIGLKAMLVGWSMPMLRLWDGIRAVDYVAMRPEIDATRIGYMGQSGGGTMTALMTAVDWRLKATAPSCYLTSLGYLCKCLGPQDSEQNVFGQLSFGLNHTGYVLLPDTKVCVTGRYADMFPWGGVAQLWRTVQATAAKLGTADHYALNFAPGPHGWTESTEAASADWMAAWLKGEKDLLPLDMAKYRAMDLGFDMARVEHGLEGAERGVLGGKRTTNLDGARDIHAILRERMEALRAARKPRTAAELSALVKRRAVIRDPGALGLAVRELSSVTTGGVTAVRLAFAYPDGRALPAVLISGGAVDAMQAPVILTATAGRGVCAQRAAEIVGKGGRVLVADVSGVGEIRAGRFTFYRGKDVPEEGTAVMLYLLGESLVGRQATDLLAFADYLKTRFGQTPRLEAEGSVAIAAAHAKAAEPTAFGGLAVREAPPSWTQFLEQSGEPMVYRYAWCVNGALADYDWTDLL